MSSRAAPAPKAAKPGKPAKPVSTRRSRAAVGVLGLAAVIAAAAIAYGAWSYWTPAPVEPDVEAASGSVAEPGLVTKVESLYNDIYLYRQGDGNYLLSFGAKRLHVG